MKFLEAEFADDPIGFSREALGLWTSTSEAAVIPMELWRSLGVPDLALGEEIYVAVDVASPKHGAGASICAGALQHTADGTPPKVKVAHIESRQGMDMTWIAKKLLQMSMNQHIVTIVVDGAAAGFLEAELRMSHLSGRLQQVSVQTVSSYAKQFVNLVYDQLLQYRSDVDLLSSVENACQRYVAHGKTWLWDKIYDEGPQITLVGGISLVAGHVQRMMDPVAAQTDDLNASVGVERVSNGTTERSDALISAF